MDRTIALISCSSQLYKIFLSDIVPIQRFVGLVYISAFRFFEHACVCNNNFIAQNVRSEVCFVKVTNIYRLRVEIYR